MFVSQGAAKDWAEIALLCAALDGPMVWVGFCAAENIWLNMFQGELPNDPIDICVLRKRFTSCAAENVPNEAALCGREIDG